MFQQQKIILFLISKINPYATEFKNVTFTIQEFCNTSGAKMVSGFTKKVNFDLCAIHDAALIAETITCKQIPSIINHMNNLYGGLQKKLGFRYVLQE